MNNELEILSQQLAHTKAALIDMDGVLYDSMKFHTLAWYKMVSEHLGIPCDRNEFYLFEGMTGKATINLLMQRHFGHDCSDDEIARLYAIKSDYFKQFGQRIPMPGADRMLAALDRLGLTRVLVTGSGQASIIEALDHDYPGVFTPNHRITAADVVHGKPDPEPYLRGLKKASLPIGSPSADTDHSSPENLTPDQAIVIENAPLGVRAGKAAGIFTIAVTTGPIPREAFEAEQADLILPSMPAFASLLESISPPSP